MFGSAPKFPTFETWSRMSENEQDALLAEIQRARRRRSILLRCLLAVVICAFVAAGIGTALFIELIVDP